MAEEKLSVNKSAVQISPTGQLQIHDQAVLAKLQAHGVKSTADLSKAAVSVGVVVSF
jgi:hypothetical protein